MIKTLEQMLVELKKTQKEIPGLTGAVRSGLKKVYNQASDVQAKLKRENVTSCAEIDEFIKFIRALPAGVMGPKAPVTRNAGNSPASTSRAGTNRGSNSPAQQLPKYGDPKTKKNERLGGALGHPGSTKKTPTSVFSQTLADIKKEKSPFNGRDENVIKHGGSGGLSETKRKLGGLANLAGSTDTPALSGTSGEQSLFGARNRKADERGGVEARRGSTTSDERGLGGRQASASSNERRASGGRPGTTSSNERGRRDGSGNARGGAGASGNPAGRGGGRGGAGTGGNHAGRGGAGTGGGPARTGGGGVAGRGDGRRTGERGARGASQ